MAQPPLIAEVIIPVPVKSNFHYLIPGHLASLAQTGVRVLASFGRQKVYTGLIRRLLPADELDVPTEKLKELLDILDDRPIYTHQQMEMLDWIAFYYYCTPGEVLKAALPAGLKLESALKVKAVDGLNWPALELDDKEYLLLEALDIQPVLGFKEVAEIWQIINPRPRLQTMANRGLIHLYQEVEDKYKPKYKAYLRLAPDYQDEEILRIAFDQLKRAPAQENILMYVVAEYYQERMVPRKEMVKSLGVGNAAVKALLDKGVLMEEKVQIDRLELHGYDAKPLALTPTPAQQQALTEIRSALGQLPKKPVLLHGITGSGKTLIYLELIKEVLAEGKQVLYLLPEITLTKQIIDRIQNELGQGVGVYHSRFNDHERVEIWQHVRDRKYQVVIGVRSAIFLPFSDLGMIVVDEEHDTSFKQYEPAPRYHARDVAVYVGATRQIPVILGSATPAYESYQNVGHGKYHLVELTERATQAQLPTIELVDMRMQRKQRLNHDLFSRVLLTAMEEALERKEQIILFQNRRGYSPYLVCETCGHVPQCINCDISLTLHKQKDHLRCHYCGYTDPNTQKCDNCHNYTLKWVGIGTEKIAELAQELFPNHVVERMDLDTTRTKYGYQKLISRFEQGQIDILVGTQMVSKGLDFENVTLVGVILADHLLTFPDFRAYEHAYQLLTQVSGRAGRSHKKGRVVIQTYMPDNVVLKAVQEPFPDFLQKDLPSRKEAHYPPYTRLIRIHLQHKVRDTLEAESLRLDGILRPTFGASLLGPDYALVARVRNTFRMQFLLKISRQQDPKALRIVMRQLIDKYYEVAPTKSMRIQLDVDPF